MAVSLPCRWGIEAGKLVTFPRTQSRDTPFPSPGRRWQQTGTEKCKWQSEQVCGNPLSKPHVRINCQGSNSRTPTLYPSLHPRASYPRAICFSHQSYLNIFFSSPFPHPQIPLFPPYQPSQHRSFRQPMTLLILPWPPIISPRPSAACIHWHPASANRGKPNPLLHTDVRASGVGETWMWAAPMKNPVEKNLGAEKEDKWKKKRWTYGSPNKER